MEQIFGAFPWYLAILPSFRAPPPVRPAVPLDAHSDNIYMNMRNYDDYDDFDDVLVSTEEGRWNKVS